MTNNENDPLLGDEPAIDEGPRAGRVPRLPLLIVLVVLVVVAVIGALLSGGRTKEVKTSAEVATSTTMSVDSTAASTMTSSRGPVMTGGFVATPDTTPSTTATPAGGDECTSAALLASVKASGEVDPSIVDSARVASFKCVEPYAVAHLAANGAEEVDAYFVRSGSVWRMLVIGSDVDPIQFGVPSAVVQSLGK